MAVGFTAAGARAPTCHPRRRRTARTRARRRPGVAGARAGGRQRLRSIRCTAAESLASAARCASQGRLCDPGSPTSRRCRGGDVARLVEAHPVQVVRGHLEVAHARIALGSKRDCHAGQQTNDAGRVTTMQRVVPGPARASCRSCDLGCRGGASCSRPSTAAARPARVGAPPHCAAEPKPSRR